MNLDQLLNSDEFRLPLINQSGRPFVDFLENILNNYVNTLEGNLGFLDHYKEIIEDEEQFIFLLKKSIPQIINVFEEKAKGLDPFGKFEIFMNGYVAAVSVSDKYINNKIPKGSGYFRCIKDATVRSKQFFLHKPFELVANTGQTRFSEPGSPSLYITNSLSSGFLEVRCDNVDNFQAVVLRNKEVLRVFSLDFPLTDTSTRNDEIFQQAMGLTYPLLAACFCIYEDGDVNSQEYLIPQLLSKWVKKNSFFDGVKYRSTKAFGDKFSKLFVNVVIPPKHFMREGHCPWIKQQFEMSDVCTWQTHEKDISEYFVANFLPTVPININVLTIEWPTNTGKSLPYEETEIGKMEYYMKNNPSMVPYQIDF